MKPVPSEGVCFSASLPLAWYSHSSQSCFETARYLAVLAELESASSPEDSTPPQMTAKLDLVLLWLAKVLARDMPKPCESVVGLEQLSWVNTEHLDVCSEGYVGISLSEYLPFVLMLPAKIEFSVAENNHWRISARLVLPDNEVRDLWERTVFRRHRRLIQLERGARQ